MIGPVVSGGPIVSKVLFVAQAPGDKEGPAGRPFAWTAGKTLFKWFNTLGYDEETIRSNIYFSAVCRCFPGKNVKGGDRVPSPEEIENCSSWMQKEFEILKPELVIPIGKLAIGLFLEPAPLIETINKTFKLNQFNQKFDLIPLPHPSGASPWHRTEPGVTLLKKALRKIKGHEAWKTTFE